MGSKKAKTIPISQHKVPRKQSKARKVFMVSLCLCLLFLGVFGAALGLKTAHEKYVYSSYPLKYQAEVEQAAKKYGVDKYLIYGVIKTESNFDPTAVSAAGAVGLMQLMPESFEWLQTYYVDDAYKDYTVGDLVNAEINIDYGTHLLSLMLERYENVEDTAVCAYNAGPGNVDGWLENKEYSDDGKTFKYVPVAETEEYRKRVAQHKNIFKKLYEDAENGIEVKDPAEIDPADYEEKSHTSASE